MNFTKNYKVFWRTRTLKTQIFKELKGIFCTSCYKNKQANKKVSVSDCMIQRSSQFLKKTCNLCHSEKIPHNLQQQRQLANKRSKILSTCRHRNVTNSSLQTSKRRHRTKQFSNNSLNDTRYQVDYKNR